MPKQIKKIAPLPTLDPKVQKQGADIIRIHVQTRQSGEPKLPKGFIKKTEAERMVWSKINEIVVVLNQLVDSFSLREK